MKKFIGSALLIALLSLSTGSLANEIPTQNQTARKISKKPKPSPSPAPALIPYSVVNRLKVKPLDQAPVFGASSQFKMSRSPDECVKSARTGSSAY